MIPNSYYNMELPLVISTDFDSTKEAATATASVMTRLLEHFKTFLLSVPMGASTARDALTRFLHEISHLIDVRKVLPIILDYVLQRLPSPSSALILLKLNHDATNNTNQNHFTSSSTMNDEENTSSLENNQKIWQERTKYQRPPILQQQQEVRGLPNVGNTCFLNATLQALASLDSFVTYLEEIVDMNYNTINLHQYHHHHSSELLSESLLTLLDTINGHYPNNLIPNPQGILTLVAKKHAQFRNQHEQQDAEEFLQSIVSTIIQEWETSHGRNSLANMLWLQINDDEYDVDTETTKLKVTTNNQELSVPPTPHHYPTLLYSRMNPSPLHGWQGSPLQCCQCHHVRPIQNERFIDIPVVPTSVSNYLNDLEHARAFPGVPIKMDIPATQLPSCSLLQCLKNYTAVERVTNVQCQTCTRNRELTYWDGEVTMLEGVVKTLESRKYQNNEELMQLSRDELGRATQFLEYLKGMDPDDPDGIVIPMIREMDALDDSFQHEEKLSLVHGDALKCMLLTRLPTILCIHVQRRFLDPHKHIMAKTVQHVDFTERLDMSTLSAYGDNPEAASFAGTANHASTITSSTSKSTPLLYQLQSVIEHRGNANTGHYQCYRRTTNGNWMFISDDVVQSIEWKHVQNCEAYMLFYEAVMP